MKQIELTSKLVLAIIGITSVGVILVPTYAVPTIKSADIFDETIQSVDIKNGEVKTVDLAPGAVKPNVRIVTGEHEDIPPGTDGSARVDCSSGELVTGGGFQGTENLQVYINLPLNDHAWLVVGANESPDTNGDLLAYALCEGPSP